MINTNIDINYKIEEFEFSDLPQGKWQVFAYSYVCVRRGEVFIQLILKEVSENNNYCITEVNVKSLRSYPLSRIIENKKLSSEFITNHHESLKVKFDFTQEKIDTKSALEIPELSNILNSIPKEIVQRDKYIYNPRQGFALQRFKILKDLNNEHTIIFPDYEIIRIFYFTTSSMIRTILKSRLESLYKLIPTIDNKTGHGVIHLNFSANNNDAPNIFRFIMDLNAKSAFEQVQAKLLLNAQILLNQQRHPPQMPLTLNTVKRTYFGADFPTKELVDMNLSVLELAPNTFLAMHIIEESSSYPFTTLQAIRQRSSRSNEENKTFKAKNIADKPDEQSKKITNETPSSVNKDIYINTSSAEINIIHSDLKNKSISFETEIIDTELQHNNQAPINQITDSQHEYSFSEAKTIGDQHISPAETQLTHQPTPTAKDNINNFGGTGLIDKNNTLNNIFDLNDFNDMINYCKEELPDSTVELIEMDDIPFQSEESKSRKAPNITIYNDYRRQYIGAKIIYHGVEYILLEIERDQTYIKSLGTIVIINLVPPINNDDIVSIIQDFVNFGGVWKGDTIKKYKKFHIPHQSSEINEHKIWAKRVCKWLKNQK